MNKQQADQLGDAIIGINERTRAEIAELRVEVVALRAQVEARRYRGVWQAAEVYERENQVTFDGSLWIAVADAPGKPGQAGWQLAVKRGADAR